MGSLSQRAKYIFHHIVGHHRGFTFVDVFQKFKTLLELNNKTLELIADMGDKLSGDYIFDKHYIHSTSQKMADYVYKLIYNLNSIAPHKYLELYDAFNRINSEIESELQGRLVIPESSFTMPYRMVNRDYSDVVGSKNANLAELKNFLQINTPDGFAITTGAFQVYMEYNNIWKKILPIIQKWIRGELSINHASRAIQDLINAGSIPNQLKKELKKAIDELHSTNPEKPLFLAIRSSAWGEDSEHTFAGQFLSLLNEPAENLYKAYKAVLASAYSENAMQYRRDKGYDEHEVAMAVACQTMVDASVSGVIYTLDPQNQDIDTILISSTWGLGAPIVSGDVEADQFSLNRDPPHDVKSLRIVRKKHQLVPIDEGGTKKETVPEDIQTKSSLKNEQLNELAMQALIIERYFKKPQDIEFSYSKDGTLFILQARPLNIRSKRPRLVDNIPETLKNVRTIFAGKGSIAQKGIGIGKVFLIKSEEDLDHFPESAVLVARNTSPRFAKVIRKASAVITDIGSPTGHMATIAREFRVPTIVNTKIATNVLKQGQEITVDAEENAVYEGKVKELCYYEFSEESFEESYEYRLLRRILKKISPLNLLDPLDKTFKPRYCKTFHDIIRFVHEKAVEEIINLGYYDARAADSRSFKLHLPVPLDLVLIDIGGGIESQIKDLEITFEKILSIPMAAFVEGLISPGAWNTDPMAVDFGSFMSSLTRTFSSSLASPKYIGQNLGVISLNYSNISLRLGYHFNMIDAYISEDLNDNYAYFRILGGVTDLTRRSRRAKLIGEILSINDFRVDLRGDLVVARIRKLGFEEMKEKLRLIGLLVAFTRQLDVKMVNDNQITKFIHNFSELSAKASVNNSNPWIGEA